MSEDWFDKTYRSDETSPADLDARILKQARRATRRWAVALVAGAVFTIAVALVLAIVLTNIELDVPPTGRQPARDTEPSATADPAGEVASGETDPQRNCARSLVLVGPFGGSGRQDRAEICLAGDLLRAQFFWDGESSCPSRLEVEASADTPVLLEQGDLVIGPARYRCVDGEWTSQ